MKVFEEYEFKIVFDLRKKVIFSYSFYVLLNWIQSEYEDVRVKLSLHYMGRLGQSYALSLKLQVILFNLSLHAATLCITKPFYVLTSLYIPRSEF